MKKITTMKTFKKAGSFLAATIMVVSLAACGGAKKDADISATTEPSAGASVSTTDIKQFPEFKAKDFDGNEVDDSIFSKNSLTVLNFWFNGCSACVDEMPELEKLNQKLKEKGAELVGVNVEAGSSDAALKEAKSILEKQGAAYKNIMLESGKEIDDFLSTIYGFPSTILVDRDGNIIGEPILGSIDEARAEEILKMVDEASTGEVADDPSKGETAASEADTDSAAEVPAEDNYEIASLIEEENNLLIEHESVWNKIFDSIPKEKAANIAQNEYVDLLKDQIEQMKDSFTKEELKTLNEDIEKIEEIEQKIMSLEEAENAGK